LGHSGRSGEATVKRIATTLLVAGLLATPMLVLPPPALAAVDIGISVNIAPPPLPVYEQPVIPAPGYIWTPGYWAWDPSFGYYWVPGTWVMPPQVGLLWTPGWWGWSDGFYRWHAGYWGSRVGFYGGVNYGYGYFGSGYAGGEWRGNQFYYNRAVNNVDVANVRNVYVNRTVINNVHVNRVSYNGGRGGLTARPSSAQRTYANQRRVQPTSMQIRQRETAMRDPAQRFKTNHGKPAVFATQHAGKFDAPHVVRASGAPKTSAALRPETRSAHTMEAPHNRTAPSRASANPSQARPEPRNGHMVQAPHNRSNEHAPAKAVPRPEQRPGQQRARPNPEMQRARPQPEMQHAQPQPEMQRERPMPMRQPQPRNEQAAPRQAPQERGKNEKREKRPPPKSSGGH